MNVWSCARSRTSPIRCDHQFDATASRHVAQRNIAGLRGADAQDGNIVLNVAPGHSAHAAEIQTVELIRPAALDAAHHHDAQSRPRAALDRANRRRHTPQVATTTGGLNLGGLDNTAIQNVVGKQQQFSRSTDPLQVTLVTRAALQTGQAHVVRVQQVHDGTTLVGGFTTVLLPT